MNTVTTTDPVCGMPVDPATAQQTSEYEGQTYYFCSPGCKGAFEADPQRYVGAREAANTSASDDAHARHGSAGAHGGAAEPHAAAHHGLHDLSGGGSDRAGDLFARDAAGLADALATAVIELRDGDTFDLRDTPVRKRIGDATVKMLG